ncbi:hypothetical protein [Streptomyces sp. NPDC049585]|uniref:hypothetical protein n=1 Tax=Streptomyces sp. NPDC049585 TaxID=3155154 RepID=UPI00342BD6C1
MGRIAAALRHAARPHAVLRRTAVRRTAGRRRRVRSAPAVAGAALLLFLTAAPAGADASVCDGGTCVIVEGSGLYVAKISASPAPDGDFFGHFHLYGAGLNTTSAVRHWRHGQRYTLAPGRRLPAPDRICVEGVEHVEEKTLPHGRACATIR